ncbi:metalloregulator ArsR/SmtB family transcription factor [Sedimenticola hydrogenitrophicus]|uniref:metalloregulator ArsR/SmtB family transcription factor n=1 Tax=Sedimenticola hydrogenitrophicus TaxID=2967975 RepID=UPI0023B1F3AA|nr:metalloregulator ArsR/SmtB family transcription factor [Sedimenticola hydrogenitrophicus]
MDPTQLFKALSDPTRLRCLSLLAESDELCVCELTQALDLPQPKISHHLGALRKAGLVLDRKEGLWIHYRINPGLPTWARDVIGTTAAGIRDQEPFAGDSATLHAATRRAVELCAS